VKMSGKVHVVVENDKARKQDKKYVRDRRRSGERPGSSLGKKKSQDIAYCS